MILRSKIVHSVLNKTRLKHLFTKNRSFVRGYFNYIHLINDPYTTFKKDQQNKFEKTFGLVRDLRAKNALEIGCGDGRLCSFLTAISEKVLAIDISDIAIRKAKKINRDNPNIEYKRADLLTDNFFDQKYDLIFCSEVLYYFQMSQLNEVIPKNNRLS